MAVTFESIPNNYSPSDNPLTYVFSSDQTAQANFSFKVETILNGSVVSENKVYIEVSDRAHYDCSPDVTNLMQKPRVTTLIGTDMDTIYTLQLRVTEVYGSTPTEQATATSTVQYTFKACLPLDEWETVDFATDYLNTKWLTDAPNNTFRVIRGQDVICSILLSGSNAITIKFYDSSDVLLDTFAPPAGTTILTQLNVSSANMTSIYAGGGTYADVSYFTAQIGTSEILTFIYVDEYCNGINSLVWLNKYGTFDQYPIEHNVSESTTIEPRSYKKKYGNWSGTSFEYDVNDSGNIDFEKIMNDSGELTTNYMTDTVQNWFVSAYDSPKAYLYNRDGLQFRLNLTGTGYKKKQGRFEDLISETMKYSKSMNRRSVKL